MFTTTNNSFGPTEISYLENRFCNMAIEAGRYVVKNGNDPNPGNITEETESELEEFIDYAKIVMGTLGHKVFEPFAPSAESAPIHGIWKRQGFRQKNKRWVCCAERQYNQSYHDQKLPRKNDKGP